MNPFLIDVIIAPNDPNGWDIATAVGTIGAVVVALVLGLVEQHRAARRQRDELERLAQERDIARQQRDAAERAERTREREAQARQIVVWTSLVTVEPATVQIRCENFSGMPVFGVCVIQFMDQETVRLYGSHQTVTPGNHLDRYVDEAEIGGVEPLGLAEFGVQFRDAAGVTWRRHTDGRLFAVAASAAELADVRD